MKKETKPPLLGQKKAMLLAGTGIMILVISFLASNPIILGAETNSEPSDISIKPLQEEMVTLQSNSLASVSTPPVFDPNKIQEIRVIMTGYSSTPCQTDDTPFITASGERVADGIVANNYFPFGTKIRMPELFGDKVFVVKDRMHWTKDNYHFDIWFPEYDQAVEFGVKKTQIEIINE